MGIGLTDLNRSGHIDLWRIEIADELGRPITQDCGVRIATTQQLSTRRITPARVVALSAHYAGRIK
jgi:hypothetical protein